MAPGVSALAAEPLPVESPDSPVLITGYQIDNGELSFIQLYNDSSSIISLADWKVEYIATNQVNEVVVPINLSAWLLPGQYAVIGQTGIVTGGDSEFSIPIDLSGYSASSLKLVPLHDYAPYIITGALFASGVRYELSRSSAGNYTSTSKFKPVSPDLSLYGGGLYAYPDENPLRITEILANPRDCSPLEDLPNCNEFIEIHNPSDQSVDMSLYRLRFGYANQPAGIANTVHLNGSIAPGSYYAVTMRDDDKSLDITANGGNVWLEDVQGLRLYEATVLAYEDVGDSDYKGFSWALDGGGMWKWAVVSPGSVNNFAIPAGLGSLKINESASCRDDQYLNPETNRCRLIVSSESTAKPCEPDEYRNPSTNRCRSLETTASTLKPCNPDQYRSPVTNRCRNAESDSNELAPCKEGQERNPETNRCRNVTSGVLGTAFAPDPIMKTGEAFTGWWALGGIGTIALGRLGWEWREEVRHLIEKGASFFTSSK